MFEVSGGRFFLFFFLFLWWGNFFSLLILFFLKFPSQLLVSLLGFVFAHQVVDNPAILLNKLAKGRVAKDGGMSILKEGNHQVEPFFLSNGVAILLHRNSSKAKLGLLLPVASSQKVLVDHMGSKLIFLEGVRRQKLMSLWVAGKVRHKIFL